VQPSRAPFAECLRRLSLPGQRTYPLAENSSSPTCINSSCGTHLSEAFDEDGLLIRPKADPDRSEAIVVQEECADGSPGTVILPFLWDKDVRVAFGEERCY
jgi:hypothetical protein